MRLVPVYLIFLATLLGSFSLSAQSYDQHWFVGNGGIFDFTGGGAPVITFPGGFAVGECASSVTDPSGNLQFFTNGAAIYNRNLAVMPNGNGIQGGSSSSDGTLILPKPGSCREYYVFTLEDHLASPIDFRYSVVDMNLNGGLGDVIVGQKNIFRATNLSENMTAIPHANGTDWWVLTHPVSSSNFQAWLVTGTGVATVPVVSSAGNVYSATNYIGCMRANHAGTKIANCVSFGSTFVQLHDFDNATGIVTNSYIAGPAVNTGPYGLEFSPNDNILYVSTLWVSNRIVQVDAATPSITNTLATLGSPNYQFGKIVLAPDGSMIIAKPVANNFATISNPDVWGAGANFVLNSIAMPGGYVGSPGLNHYPPALQTNNIVVLTDSILSTTIPCRLDSVEFEFQANYAYDSIRWNFGDPGSGTANQSVLVNPFHDYSSSGTYTVQVIVFGCYPDTLTQTLVLNTGISVNLGPDISICPGGSTVLDAGNPAFTFLWNTGAITQTINATTSGTYSVFVTDSNGCTGTDTIIVSTTPVMVSLGPDVSMCPGGSTVLDAGNPAFTFLWNTGAITQTINATASGTYSVIVTDTNGCSGTDTITVSTTPVIVNLGPDISICPGGSTVLNAGNPAFTFLWNTGAITQTINATASGTYSVIVTDTNGCTGTDTIIVSTTPVMVNLGPDISICTGGSTVLDAGNPAFTFLWNTGAITQTINATTSGTYSVIVTDTNGCTGTDTILVSTTPVIVNLGPDITRCQGGPPTVLNAGNPGSTYVWSTGSTNQTINVNGGGYYSVTVTSPGGCTGADTIGVTFNPRPNVNLGPPRRICAGSSTTIDAGNAGSTFQWSNGATTQSITVSNPGNYQVTVTNSFGCTDVDDIMVQVRPLPTVNLGPDISICPGQSVTLNPGPPGGGGGGGTPNTAYNWSTGSIAPTITVNTAGTYSITVTNTYGGGGGGGGQLSCANFDTVNVIQLAAPQVNLGPDRAICDGNEITLNAGATAQWSTGATASSIVVNQGGQYWANVTGSNGCTGRDTVNVTVSQPPVVEITGPSNFCEGDSAVLDAGNAGSSFLWSNGQSTQQIWVYGTGTYSVTVTNAAGCRKNDGFLVRITEDFPYTLGPDTTLCMEEPLTLGTKVTGTQSIWSTGAFSDLIRVEQSGTYSVTVENACFTHSDTIEVTFLNGPGPFVPNAFTPNGDGLNDVFGFVTGPDIQSFYLGIYDRWGKMIFETKEQGRTWDGKIDGYDAPEGVYAYRVQYQNCLGILTDRGGSITLIR